MAKLTGLNPENQKDFLKSAKPFNPPKKTALDFLRGQNLFPILSQCATSQFIEPRRYVEGQPTRYFEPCIRFTVPNNSLRQIATLRGCELSLTNSCSYVDCYIPREKYTELVESKAELVRLYGEVNKHDVNRKELGGVGVIGSDFLILLFTLEEVREILSAAEKVEIL